MKQMYRSFRLAIIVAGLALAGNSALAQTAEEVMIPGATGSAAVSIPTLMTLSQALSLANPRHPKLLQYKAANPESDSQYAQRLQRIEIMRQFFAVLAADYQFAADNEAMSISFFPFNRAQQQRERFKSVSEVEVLEKRSVYLARLSERNQSIRRQRASRFQLALAMGHPDVKPDGLVEPDLSVYQRELPDFDTLLVSVLQNHPLIQQKRQDLAQSDTAGLSDREIASQQADLAMLDYELREQVLAWVQTLEALEQEINWNEQNLEYAERVLDKARLLYEMEVRSQIGRAQAQMARILWQAARAKFERALIWEQIDAALGAPIVEFE